MADFKKYDTGNASIGGLFRFELDLRNQDGSPKWRQPEPLEGSESAYLPPPFFDCVRLDIEEHRQRCVSAFQREDDFDEFPRVGRDVFIVGYPYGFSSNDTSVEPIFLRRSVASVTWLNGQNLLDGQGAEGMSGGPVLTRVDNEWRLFGIYNGAIFPEASFFQERLGDRNAKSQLPLGKFTKISVVRRSVGVPDLGVHYHRT